MNRAQGPVAVPIPVAPFHQGPYWEADVVGRRVQEPVFLGTWLNVWKRICYDLWALKKRPDRELYLIVWGNDPIHFQQWLPLELACAAKCLDHNNHLANAREHSEAFDEARRRYRIAR